MDRDALVIGIAAVFAGIAVVMAILGLSTSLFFVVVAAPFGAASYLMWYQATGRMAAGFRRTRPGSRGPRATEGPRGPGSRFGREARRRARATGRGARSRAGAGGRAASAATDAGMSRREAYGELDLPPGASDEEVKRAYRERVKETHPDSGGDEEEFKRVAEAYESLTDG